MKLFSEPDDTHVLGEGPIRPGRRGTDQEPAMDLSSYPNGEGHVVEVRGELTAREPLAKLPLAVQNVLDRESAGLVKVNVAHVEIIDLDGVAALIRLVKLPFGAELASSSSTANRGSALV